MLRLSSNLTNPPSNEPTPSINSSPLKNWNVSDAARLDELFDHTTMRTNLRRLTRLSNGFSRKFANLKAALSLWFWYYNFCRIHGTIRVTPAMELGIANRVWSLHELIA